VCAYVDINANDFAATLERVHGCAGFDGVTHIQHGQQTGTQYQRTAVRNAGLDDEVRADLPHQFLHRHHILRILDDGAAHPVKVVDVFALHGGLQPVARQRTEGGIGTVRNKPFATFLGKLGDSIECHGVSFRSKGQGR